MNTPLGFSSQRPWRLWLSRRAKSPRPNPPAAAARLRRPPRTPRRRARRRRAPPPRARAAPAGATARASSPAPPAPPAARRAAAPRAPPATRPRAASPASTAPIPPAPPPTRPLPTSSSPACTPPASPRASPGPTDVDVTCSVPDPIPGTVQGTCITVGGDIECNPVTNEFCDSTKGEACDFEGKGYHCYPGLNTRALCETCGPASGVGQCKPGSTCLPGPEGKCGKFCCSTAECGTGKCDKSAALPGAWGTASAVIPELSGLTCNHGAGAGASPAGPSGAHDGSSQPARGYRIIPCVSNRVAQSSVAPSLFIIAAPSSRSSP